MAYGPIATGRVESLCLNGTPVESLTMKFDGPIGDTHSGTRRVLSGHDHTFIRTSKLLKGDLVFNARSWTGLSMEELQDIEKTLGVKIPQGCLLENITVRGIPAFSQLPPTSRLVFPFHQGLREGHRQAILAVWEENTPCKTVGQRLADHHGDFDLMAKFVTEANGKRGVMGFVYASGRIVVGDEVLVYPPGT